MSYLNLGRPIAQLTRYWRNAKQVLLLATGLLVAACGGSGSSSSPPPAAACSGNCGTAMLSITDAPGDFLSYSVDVTSVTLKRPSGTVVETIPATTRVDFAQLVNLSEVFSARQIPAGEYSQATVTLDFSTANIVVDDGTAAGLKVTPVDSSGAPLTTLTLNVDLGRDHLQVNPGHISHLALDFNLLASNTVDLITAKVTVDPVLMTSLVPAATKSSRVGGELVSVDSANGVFTLTVSPFEKRGRDHGQVSVVTNATTVFNVNGSSYTGTDGLVQLASLPAGTQVLATGKVSGEEHTFTADNVIAGSALGNAGLDRIEGTVVARNGNELLVRGARLEDHADESEEDDFQRRDVVVTLADATKVSKDGNAGAFSIADISIGQHAVFYGVATRSSTSSSSSSMSSSQSSHSEASSASSSQSSEASESSSSLSSTSSSVSTSAASASSASSAAAGIASVAGASGKDGHHDDVSGLPTVTFDASAGSVRLQLTSVVGTVASSTAHQIVVNVAALDGQDPSTLDFTGTNANPAAYLIGFNADLVTLPAQSKVRVLGFVAPFTAAPGAGSQVDFNAATVVSYAAVPSVVEIRWDNAGVTAPFTTVSDTPQISQVTIDASSKAEIKTGDAEVGLLTASGHSTGLVLAAPATGSWTQYAIAHRTSRTVTAYATFADFAAAAQTALASSGVTALGLVASGAYDASTATLTASEAALVVSD